MCRPPSCRGQPRSRWSIQAPLGLNFSGLNFFNQRFDADGGNQLSVEPPDQGLCVGNGLLIEAVNAMLAIYNASTGTRSRRIRIAERVLYERSRDRFVRLHRVRGVHHRSEVPLRRRQRALLHDDYRWPGPVTGALSLPFTVRISTSKTNSPTVSPSDWNLTTINVTNDGTDGTASHRVALLRRPAPDRHGCERFLHHHERVPDHHGRLQRGADLRFAEVRARCGDDAEHPAHPGAPIPPDYGKGIPIRFSPRFAEHG